MKQRCKCCGRQRELRLGYCFDCVESEAVIQNGVDMYDKEIVREADQTKGMSKLRYILKKYMDINGQSNQ